MDGLGAGAHADAVGGAAIAGELLLEGLALPAQDEPALVQHPLQGIPDLPAHLPVLGLEVVELDSHGSAFTLVLAPLSVT